MKNGPKFVKKNENFQKKYFVSAFYVTLSLHAKKLDCRYNQVACGQYKDKL